MCELQGLLRFRSFLVPNLQVCRACPCHVGGVEIGEDVGEVIGRGAPAFLYES